MEIKIATQKRSYSVLLSEFMAELVGNRVTVTVGPKRLSVMNARLLHEALGGMLEVQEEEGEQ